MSDRLPEGWEEIDLPCVATLNMGQSPPSNTYNTAGEGLPFFQGKAEFGDLYPHPEKFCSDPKKIADAGDILISVRAPVGPTNICRERSCIGRGLAAIRPRGGISGKYLLFFFRSIEAWLATKGSGSTFTAISKTDLEQLTLRVAPLAEQRRIVAKLETLLGKVDACQRRLAKIPRVLKRFRQSVLAAACSGRLTTDWREENSGADYERTTVGAVAEYVGGFAYKSPTFLEKGKHQVIRIGNVRPLALKLDASPVFLPDDIAEQTRRFKLLASDIVISMTGTKYRQDYGFASLVSESDGSLFLNQRVARVRCNASVHPKFLLYWFQTDSFREFFFAGETGNVNQGNVGASGIRNAPIELPPLAEQQEIVSRVEQLFKLADQIEARYAKAQAHVDKLTQSLLAKAFRGELVPQDPNDEPAEKLLERIRSAARGPEQSNGKRKYRK